MHSWSSLLLGFHSFDKSVPSLLFYPYLMHAVTIVVLVFVTFFVSASAAAQHADKVAQPFSRVHLPPQEEAMVARNPKSPAAKSIWKRLECDVCKHAIGKMIGFVVDHGCDLADPVAAAACAVAGVFEPLCAAALIEGCSIIVEDVVNRHIASHTQICKDIHMCK